MAKIRTFVAVELPDELKQEVDKLIVRLKPFGPDVRWVRADNLHFTLRFLGDIDESEITKLTELIRKAIENQKRFRLRLSGLGCFPNMKRPRVVWLGADGDMDFLREAALGVESACRECGFGKSDKPFSAHLTIGRIKNPRGLEPFIKQLEKTRFESADFEIDHITIFKSDLSPRGPKYTALAKIELA